MTVAYSIGGLPFTGAYSTLPPLRFGDPKVGEAFLRYAPEAWQAPGVGEVLFAALGLLGLWGLLRPPARYWRW
ncbi:MAG: hypothetical protein RL685_988 [Pseudomonadota bacterium]|jgi:hypothetical protein